MKHNFISNMRGFINTFIYLGINSLMFFAFTGKKIFENAHLSLLY